MPSILALICNVSSLLNIIPCKYHNYRVLEIGNISIHIPPTQVCFTYHGNINELISHSLKSRFNKTGGMVNEIFFHIFLQDEVEKNKQHNFAQKFCFYDVLILFVIHFCMHDGIKKEYFAHEFCTSE